MASDRLLDQLTDAVAYDRFRSPFHGDGGQVSCCFAPGGPLGLGPLRARAAEQTRFITQTTTQLWLQDGGRWQAVPRQALRSRPAVAEEEGRWSVDGQPVFIQARTVFADERTLWHEQCIRNDGDRPIVVSGALCGQVDPERAAPASPQAALDPPLAPRRVFAEVDGLRLRCGLRGSPSLPCPAVQIEAMAGVQTLVVQALPVWVGASSAPVPGEVAHHAFHWSGVTLAPGAVHRVLLCLRYVPAWHAAPVPAWPDGPVPAPDLDALIVAQHQALGQRLGAGTAAVDAQLLRARYALQRCSYRGRGDGAFGPHRACLCTPGTTSFSVVFFWDALFSAAAISGFDPDYARDAIRVPLRQIKGRWLQRTWDWRAARAERIPQPQAPVASWALAHHLALHDDEAFLAELYPTLTALHEFWKTQDADGDGLPEWSFTGLNADNGPHYLPYMPRGVHNVYIPPVASVSLGSFLHLDARLLAGFAARLGRGAEARDWSARADFLAERLRAVCWHAGDRTFYDFDHHAGEHNRVRAHLQFWALSQVGRQVINLLTSYMA